MKRISWWTRGIWGYVCSGFFCIFLHSFRSTYVTSSKKFAKHTPVPRVLPLATKAYEANPPTELNHLHIPRFCLRFLNSKAIRATEEKQKSKWAAKSGQDGPSFPRNFKKTTDCQMTVQLQQEKHSTYVSFNTKMKYVCTHVRLFLSNSWLKAIPSLEISKIRQFFRTLWHT